MTSGMIIWIGIGAAALVSFIAIQLCVLLVWPNLTMWLA